MSYRWGECNGCLSEDLLKRVQVWPGVYDDHETYHLYLCLQCRVNWRDDQYCSLAESFNFNRVARLIWRNARAQQHAAQEPTNV